MKRLFFCLALILILISFVSATDVAYVVKTSSNVDSKVTNAFSNLNYSYEVIIDSQIASTDWSEYNILFIQDVLTNEALLPLSSKNSVFLEKEIAEQVWTTGTLSIAFTTFDYLHVLESNIFSEGIFGNTFDPYITTSASKKVYYLNAKPSYVKRVAYSENQLLKATIAYSNDSNLRRVFFGLPNVALWTQDTQKIFENSIKWAISGADGDGDGYLYEQDCDDSNSDVWQYLQGYTDLDLDGFGNGSILSVCSGEELSEDFVENNLDCDDLNENTWPGAEEIEYDLIDNDCDGFDLADVDGDGYCDSGYEIINSTAQCSLETGLVGTDCNDNDSLFNIGSDDLTMNCVNDAPAFTSEIFNITVLETEIVYVNFSAEDPEGEAITYTLNDSRFVEDSEGEFSWETDYFDSGIFFVEVNASDGDISTKAVFKVEVLNNNRAPICDEIPEISWEEDSNYSLNLSEYCYDEDLETLNFSFYNTSTNTEIVLDSLNRSTGIANFSSHSNWYGEDWIMFSVSDGNNMTLTNEIPLLVTPVNDAPELIKQFENINLTENVNLTDYLNLSEYFLDVDSNLTFYVTGNHFIDVSIDPETLLVSFYPEEDFFGSENIVFSASDEEEEVYGNAFMASVNSSFNRLPEFLPLDCETKINEEQEYSCIVNATDRENDTLTFSIGDQDNLDCSFDGNNLTYVSALNHNGLASCELIVSDATGSVNQTFEVEVIGINDAPELIKQFENINLTENVNLTDYLNLSEYFLDVDSNLTFYVTGNHFIEIAIDPETLLVSFYPEEDFFGSENIVFGAYDDDYTIFSNAIVLNVSSVNKAPTFLPLDCETEINEEQEYSCIVNATDRENDTLTFSVGDSSNLQCNFQDNTLTYVSSENYNGFAACEIVVSDSSGYDTISLEVDVLPVNDAPELIKQFENINLTENFDSLNILNLSEYFRDIDSNLTFNVSQTVHIGIIIDPETLLVSFYPEEDFFGSENIVFGAYDDDYTIFSNAIVLNVSSVNKAPTFLPLDCETEINEEQEYSCIVNATDRENDTLTFSIGDQDNLDCSFDGNNLTYVSASNHNGLASCELIVSDETGSRSESFEVNVLPINDAPIILSKSPESIGSLRVGQQQIFSINPFDVDGDILGFSWFLDGSEVSTDSNSYSFIALNRGNYLLEAFVFDQEYNSSTFWELFVGEESDFTCAQNNGDVCSADEFCPGSLINSSDQSSCCSVTCKQLPPSFSDIDDRCVNNSVGIKIDFENPDEDEEYTLGEDDEIEVELEIENELAEDLDFDIDVYLYDLTENEVVMDDSDDLDVDEDDRETIKFLFKLDQEDLDEDNNYAIFAYIEDGNYCSEEYQNIVFERADHALVFKQIDLGQYSSSEGRYLDVSASIDNIGADDEDFVIRVENRELGLNFRSEEFELDEDKKKTFDFEVLLPSEIDFKAYNFTFVLDYSGDRKSKTETLFIGPEDSFIENYSPSEQEALQLTEIRLGQEEQEPFYFTYQKNAYISLDDLVTVGIIPLFVIVCLIFAICLFIYVYLFNRN